MHHLITPRAVVQTADQIELRVRSIEGNVAELEAFDGSFVGYRHLSSLTVCLPPATPTAPAQSLAAAAGAGQGAGTSHDDDVCPLCGGHDVYVHQVVDGTRSMRCGECWHLWERRA